MTVRRRFVRALLAGCSALCAPAGLAAQDLSPLSDAQEQAPAVATRVADEEIVITARRRGESLGDVPISISAFSQNSLSALGVQRMDDLQRVTPSLQLRPASGRRSNSTYAIRGISGTESLITQDPPVGIYVNDVYIARSTGTNQSFFDIESVQVLYGPQGTLFGRNSPAGAVLINSRKPVDRFEGEVSVGIGNYERIEFGGMLNVPLAEGVALRVAGQRVRRDGYGRELNSGRDLANENFWSVRASLRINPSPGFDNLTVVNAYRSSDNGSLNVLAALLPCRPNTGVSGITQFQTGIPPVSCLYSPQVNAALGRGDIFAALSEQQARGPYNVRYDAQTFERARTLGFSNTTTIALSDNLTLKNIVGYNEVDLAGRIDLDGSFIQVIDTLLDSKVHQFSEELQIQADLGSLNLVVGSLYFRERGRDIQITSQLGGFSANNPTYSNIRGINTSYAIFAQGTYEITNRLSATVGGRYTWDRRRAVYDNPTLRFGTPTAACQFPVALAPDCIVDVSRSFSDPSYSLSLEYKPADDVLIYVANRRGYRSGGFNPRALTEAQLVPFRPESITDIELGFRGQFDLGEGARARTSLAIYRANYSDIQRIIAVDPDGTGPIALTSLLINAAEATIQGFEFSAGVSLPFGLDISGYWGFVDAVHDSFDNDFTASRPIFNPSPANPVQCGTTVVTAPGPTTCENVSFGVSKHNVGGTIAATLLDTSAAGRITFTANYSYRSAYYGQNSLPIIEEFSRVPGQHNLNISLEWDSIRGSGFSGRAWVRNLTDEEAIISVNSLGQSLGFAGNVYGDRRMFGLTVSYQFGR